MHRHTRIDVPRSIAVALILATTSIAAVAATVAVTFPQDQGPGRPGGRGPGGLSGIGLFMALDKDGTPGLSAAEVANATAVLQALDRNGDGSLSPDELPAFGRGGRGDGPEGGRGRGGRGDEPGETAPTSTDELAATLMAFDQNNDGKLTRAEVPERFQGLFDRADANKDGVLTPDELKQSAAAQPSPSQARGRDEGDGGRDGREGRRGGPFGGADPLIGALDLNSDGRLSSDELANVPTVLRRFDRNGDGVVMLDEIFVGFGRGRGRG
jgi:Ca2+-binding EF-hand superfamily protein